MRLIFAVFVFWALATAGYAQSRAAFVVGNSAYENATALDNPINDARLVSEALASVGFDVTTHTDLTRAQFGRALSDFIGGLEAADVVVFFFAGHGMQLDGENLLLGTDARLQSEFDVLAESIPLDTVAEALRRKARSVLVFLDACRDNPIAQNFFAENFPQARSLETRGLAEVQTPEEGTMFFFAASPGQVAFDGIGRNSPFSLALSRHLTTPGLEVLTMTKRVVADVRVLTRGRQNPTVTNDVAVEIYLAGAQTAGAISEPNLEAQAAAAWEDFRDSTSPDAFDAFAEAYPATAYAALALSSASRLRAGPDAARDPPPLSRPAWCDTPRNEAETLICDDAELLELDRELAELNDSRLNATRTGAARGQALVDQRNWRISRDACGTDRACIAQSYRVRIIALGEFGTDAQPTAITIRSVQEELNRLSCGAGVPDGVAGGNTAQAYALAASLSDFLDPDAPLDTVETLARLRSVGTGLCSYILRASDDPGLLEGVWRAEFPTCRSGTTEVDLRRFRLEAEGNGIYSGGMAYGMGDFSNAVGGHLVENTLALVFVSPVGFRQVYTFQPGPAPYEFSGYYGNGECTMSVTR